MTRHVLTLSLGYIEIKMLLVWRVVHLSKHMIKPTVISKRKKLITCLRASSELLGLLLLHSSYSSLPTSLPPPLPSAYCPS